MNQRMGRYQILEEIASGGQGSVYRAFDPQTGQIVALKVLHARLSADEAYLERFHREAQLSASIDHPNVIRVFEVAGTATPTSSQWSSCPTAWRA
jgi:serine/threonine-protein kinase